MHALLLDLKLAVRSLRRSPGFAIVAAITVALGVGSATAIYSVADAVVFRPLPFRDESSLAWVWSTRPDRDRAFFSVPDLLDLRRDTQTVADLAAISPLGVNLTGLGEPERVQGWRVTANLFSLLGTKAQLGRVPQAHDGIAGAQPVVMLGYGYWQRRFGGEDVVGRVVTLNGNAHTIIGVLPREFLLPNGENNLFVVQSLENDPRRADRSTNFLRAVVRVKPGSSLAEAQAEFATLSQKLTQLYPETNATITAPRFVPLRDEVVGGYRSSLLLLLAATGTLLLIMAANLAGLLAARALARQRDAAMCSALGASPARLLRTYLTEGFVLAVIGGTLGVVGCWLGLNGLIALAPAELPRASLIELNWHVLAAAGVCTVVTGLGVGLAPALRLARSSPQEVLKSGSSASSSRSRARGVLVAAQIALCAVLLVGTGLLVRSLRNLLAAHPGFESAQVLTAQVALAGASYRQPSAVIAFAEEYQRRLATLPGVKASSLTHVLPLSGINTRSEFNRSDRPAAKPTDGFSAANRFVLDGFFATVGIPLLAGRDFRPDDNAAGRPVVIVDQTLARRCWPGEDPVGKSIVLRDGMSAQPRELVVVGVVGATKHFSLEEAGTPALFLPVRQLLPAHLQFVVGRLNFVAQTSGDPRVLLESARRELRALDGDASASFRSYDEVIAWAKAPRVFNLRLLATFAATAVLLAVLGLYAVTAQSVAARTRELGIRFALGAERGHVLRMVLGDAAKVTLAGIAIGLVLAAAATPLLAQSLYRVPAFDLSTYGAVTALLAAVALAASYIPARRAAKVDPVTALRAE